MDLSLQEPPPVVGSLLVLHKYAPVWRITDGASVVNPGSIILTDCSPPSAGLMVGLLRGFSAAAGCIVDFLQVDILEKIEPKGVG